MSDDFFDDEQELMEADAAPGPAPERAAAARPRTRAAAPKASAAETPGRAAPPFWMVLAIAAIALILGVVIGYLLGTSATLAELSQGAQAVSGAGGATQLPEGHPELNVNADGTASVAGSGSASE